MRYTCSQCGSELEASDVPPDVIEIDPCEKCLSAAYGLGVATGDGWWDTDPGTVRNMVRKREAEKP